MKQRGDAATGSSYRAVVCLSGGLLLTGLVPAPAVAQAVTAPADAMTTQVATTQVATTQVATTQVATNPVATTPAATTPAATTPAASSIAANSYPQPRLLNPRFAPRFSIESKPAVGKPNHLWPTLRPEATVPQEEAVQLMLRIDERRVYVYRGDTLEASYPVAVGRSGWETPTGRFEVFSTLEEPGWTNPFTNETIPPGADNPLGDRWIAFWTDGENMIGFHGTPNRDSIGKAASHGCVRMYNEHIRELFEIVEVGTPVTVVL